MSDLIDKIGVFETRLAELESKLADPVLAKDRNAFAEIGRELASVRPVVETGTRYRSTIEGLDEARVMVNDPDPELQELARGELAVLEERKGELEQELRLLLVPRDPNDDKNVMLEIRAGTGGDEAALFAADLLRMYSRYAEKQGWKVEPLSVSDTGTGGVKEAIVTVSGGRVFSRLKHERGVHRVQRVPATESQGRIHTSTTGVLVFPEVDEPGEVDINQNDLKIDVFRSSGPGGQSVNTTDSAVRITHLPTGIVVSMQNEKSQIQNREAAMRVLRARILAKQQEERDALASDARKSQIRGMDRSERIRTYNFPENRIADHRTGFKAYNLDGVMNGALGPVIESCIAADEEARLAALGDETA